MFAMTAENVPRIFPPHVLARLRDLVDIDPALVAEDFTRPAVREALAATEILISGWGARRWTRPRWTRRRSCARCCTPRAR